MVSFETKNMNYNIPFYIFNLTSTKKTTSLTYAPTLKMSFKY